jgi:hypothetical protein
MSAMKRLVLETQEKCVKILNRSQDGNLLTPYELKLVEMGVNGKASLHQCEELDTLYETVTFYAHTIAEHCATCRGSGMGETDDQPCHDCHGSGFA